MFILKLIAAPFALAFTIASALFSLALSLSDIIFGWASALALLGSVLLLVTGQTAGGLAFMVVAVFISPAGIPALAKRPVKLLGSAGSALRRFIFS